MLTDFNDFNDFWILTGQTKAWMFGSAVQNPAHLVRNVADSCKWTRSCFGLKITFCAVKRQHRAFCGEISIFGNTTAALSQLISYTSLKAGCILHKSEVVACDVHAYETRHDIWTLKVIDIKCGCAASNVMTLNGESRAGVFQTHFGVGNSWSRKHAVAHEAPLYHPPRRISCGPMKCNPISLQFGWVSVDRGSSGMTQPAACSLCMIFKNTTNMIQRHFLTSLSVLRGVYTLYITSLLLTSDEAAILWYFVDNP